MKNLTVEEKVLLRKIATEIKSVISDEQDYRKDNKFYYIIEKWDGSVELTNYGTVYKKCATVPEAEAALREICGRLPRKTEEEDYQD